MIGDAIYIHIYIEPFYNTKIIRVQTQHHYLRHRINCIMINTIMQFSLTAPLRNKTTITVFSWFSAKASLMLTRSMNVDSNSRATLQQEEKEAGISK